MVHRPYDRIKYDDPSQIPLEPADLDDLLLHTYNSAADGYAGSLEVLRENRSYQPYAASAGKPQERLDDLTARAKARAEYLTGMRHVAENEMQDQGQVAIDGLYRHLVNTGDWQGLYESTLDPRVEENWRLARQDLDDYRSNPSQTPADNV